MKLQSPKNGQIVCGHKPYFLLPGHTHTRTRTRTRTRTHTHTHIHTYIYVCVGTRNIFGLS